MSSSEGTAARRPLRSAGIGLLGLGVVATVIGLVVGLTGDQDDRADGSGGANPAGDVAPLATPPPPPPASLPLGTAPPPSVAAAPTPSPLRTSPPAPVPPTSAAPPRTPPPAAAPAPPRQTSTAPAPGVPGPASSGSSGSPGTRADQLSARGQLRVYNNSTIPGLAARAADDFTAAGWTVAEVGNYSFGRIPTSTVYYQEGTQQRSEAEALAAEFGLRLEPRFAGITDASPGMIVIVTNDYGS